jgi:hypothetical protein
MLVEVAWLVSGSHFGAALGCDELIVFHVMYLGWM